MNITLILFLIGILGFVLNRKNIILMLISIEIMLLSITFLILVSSLNMDDIIGQTYAIYIIAVAGAESAIGLGILVAFYRFSSSLIPFCLSCGNNTYSLPCVYVPRNVNIRKRIIRSSFTNLVKNYSTTNYSKNSLSSCSPGFISGLFDAEGSFVVTILKNVRYKTGWNVQARIQIKMHEKDRALIQSIQDFFGGTKTKTNKGVTLSNSINRNTKRYYSSKSVQQNPNLAMNPWFLTGYLDAEGCFTLGITRSKGSKTGWIVQLFFLVAVHQKDYALLEQIQSYFGVGKIHKHGPQSVILRVSSVKDLEVIIDHFYKYPLVTKKLADYNLFKLAHNIIINKEHLTQEGLYKLVSIKGSLNLGLSSDLKSAFPDVTNIDKSSVVLTSSTPKIPDPYWLAGFATGEGCFYVVAQKRSEFKTGYSFKLKFSIAQHVRDEDLLRILITYFGGGILYKNREIFELVFAKFTDIDNIIIPFFAKYPIGGAKYADYQDFCKVFSLMKEKEHLTPKGAVVILKIKEGMNTGRE
jgi:NADH:ubiquinone oxidoreductase subunit K